MSVGFCSRLIYYARPNRHCTDISCFLTSARGTTTDFVTSAIEDV